MGMRSFEVELVNELGLSAAVVYGRIHDLCEEKAKRNADYHDGRFWVRLPYKDFHEVFPYLHPATVAKAIRKLRDEGLIMIAHYDEHNSLVNWYATT